MKPVSKIILIILAVQCSCTSGNLAKEKDAEPATVAAPAAAKAEEKPFANIHFASKMDTSCGMPLAAGVADTLQLNGKVYGFCSKDCKNEFAAILKKEHKR